MLSPRALAVLYDLHLAAVWRGQESASDFGAWLDGRWWSGGLAEPDTPPDAVSVLGGAGTGIRWYVVGESILGFVGRRPRGCYVMGRDDVPPLALAAPLEPAAESVPLPASAP